MLCQNLNKCKLKEGMQKTHQNIVVNKKEEKVQFDVVYSTHVVWAFCLFCLSEEYFGLFEKSIFKL